MAVLIPASREAPDARVPLSSIFVAFLRLGLTGFGGPAMVAYIGELVVKKKGWLSEQSFADGTAVCQMIPGATTIQTAGYVGLRVRGPVGALVAFAGFGLPAFLLMLVLSVVYQSSRELQPVVSAFRGLHVIVVALVAHAAVTFARRRLANWRDVVLAGGAGAFLFFRGNPFVAIIASAAIGLLLHRGIESAARPVRDIDQLGARRMVRLVLLAVLIGGMALVALFVLDRRLFNLAALMAGVDLFAFGGGYASVPMMLHEVVDVRGWMAGKTFMDGIALGQVTPGPIVITATFVGYQVAGLPGAVVGTVAVFTPSFLMVLVAVPYFDRIQHSLLVRRALRAVLASFVGLLLAVTVQFAVTASWTAPAILLSAAAFAALWFKIDVLWVVLVGASLSVFLL
jgi:chromate transporter, chromate ion transporter (CHR) family